MGNLTRITIKNKTNTPPNSQTNPNNLISY